MKDAIEIALDLCREIQSTIHPPRMDFAAADELVRYCQQAANDARVAGDLMQLSFWQGIENAVRAEIIAPLLPGDEGRGLE